MLLKYLVILSYFTHCSKLIPKEAKEHYHTSHNFKCFRHIIMFSNCRKRIFCFWWILNTSFMKPQSQLFGILVTLCFNHFNDTNCNKLIWDSCSTSICFYKAFHSNWALAQLQMLDCFQNIYIYIYFILCFLTIDFVYLSSRFITNKNITSKDGILASIRIVCTDFLVVAAFL